MSLIKCSECGSDVSDKATLCPKCGNPIHTQVGEAKPLEIQLTNKRWKKMGLYSLLMVFIALITMSKSVALGFFFLFIAVVIAFISRIGAWWTNG